MEGGFIIKDQFDGSALTFIRDGKPAYSNLSMEDYLKKEPGLRVISGEEFDALSRDLYCTPFKETTEEKWDYMLCVLPPRKYRSIHAANGNTYVVFFLGEALSGKYHSLMLHDVKADKYFSCVESVFLNDEQIVNKFLGRDAA